MPLTHTRAFRVRHYECDAYGHVNSVNYIRYMQEAAFDASAAAGYDLARYDRMGKLWLVRDTEIEYLTPLRYGDTVEITTWVADFRRVRSRRAYEMRRAGSGEMAARASTDWAFLDSATGRPAAIPPEMMAAFFPEGVPKEAPPRQRFPAPPPAPPGVFRQSRRVEWRDIDMANHVNNAVYFAYIEDSAMQVCAAHGWPMDRMQAEGFGVVARKLRLDYQIQAVLGDEVEVSTWAFGMRQASGTRHYTLTRPADGALLAQAQGFYAWVDLETGKPIRIPADFRADFAPNIVGEGE